MKKKILLLLLLLPLFYLNSKAQVRSFSKDPVVFIEEFSKYLDDSKQPEVIDLSKKFKEKWNSNLLNEDQKRMIINLTNNMLNRKLTIQPYFQLMVSGLNSYFDNKLKPELLEQWQAVSKKLVEKSDKEYLSFLNTVNYLFSENILFRNEARKWYSNTNDFDIVYDGRISIKFKLLDLTCEAIGDKMRITNTSGTYYPDKTDWIGAKGTVNWERVELPQDEVYADLTTYKIDLSKAEYVADSAYLHYKKYFPDKVLGQFSDKVSGSSSFDLIQKSSFPKFQTYNSDVEIKGLVGTRASYFGGFTLSGKTINGESVGNKPATIVLYFNKKKTVAIKSAAFKIEDGVAGSREASIEIFVDSGSIFHPKAIVSYDFVAYKLTITKGTDGLMRMPFSDTYHEVDIDVEQIRWDQSLPYIDFDMISKDKAAIIESEDFYKEFLYEKIQGILEFNPLYKMRQFAVKGRIRDFTIQDYADHLRNTKSNILEQIMDLADKGFIYYNMQNDSIHIRDKLFDYVNAHYKGKDYDNIRFSSVIKARPNFTLNLNSWDMKMEGVRKFTFSDSQNVIAVPYEQIIILKKDRNLVFGGTVRAGRIDLFSKEFKFEYDHFKIANSMIDSMVIYYPDETGRRLIKVNSVLRNINGTLLIDHFKNKSGLKPFPEYPIFTSLNKSEVTYESPSIHNSAYKKDDFRFEVDPFTIDSLDNFTIAGLQFSGTFHSADIFPSFQHTLSIQPDYSLGFVKPTPAGGLPMYKGKGKGDMIMNLSNKGFYGSGKIEYQTATVKSESFLLLPDATKATAESFDLPESTKYPVVHGDKVLTDWRPYDDKMSVTHTDNKFKVFKMQYDFAGTLTLTPANLRGNGALEWTEAVFASKDMVYGKNKVNADVSSIKIFSVDSTQVALRSDNVKGNIDFDKREGKFTSNIIGDLTYFPINQYASNMNDYAWKMDPKIIEVKPNPAMGQTKPYFVSTLASQDSLKFECSYAKFELKTSILYMEKIPYIDIADSRVFPWDGKAVVRQGADMDRLDSSRIEANRIDKFHIVQNCKTKILGKYKISAKGYYKYTTKKKLEQKLFMDSIIVDKDKHVAGSGQIAEEAGFILDTKIGYKGLFSIVSTEKPILFTGYIKPLHTFDFFTSLWIKYIEKTDPQNVVIDVNDPRIYGDKKVEVGIYFATDTNHVYPILFNAKRRVFDQPLLKDTGILFYDHDKDAFMLGSREKIINGSPRGNLMIVNERDKSIYSEGALNLGLNFKEVRILTAGNASLVQGDSVFRIKSTFLLDLPLPSKVKEELIKMMLNEYAGTAGANTQNDLTKKSLAEILHSDKTYQKAIKSIDATGNIPADDELKSGFLFTNLELYFDSRLRRFMCEGKVGVSLFDGKQINKTFDATIAIEKKKGADKFTVLLELGNGEWIFIDYVRGVCYITTSNDPVNKIIQETSESVSNDDFKLRLAGVRSKDLFLRKLE